MQPKYEDSPILLECMEPSIAFPMKVSRFWFLR